MPTVHMGNKTQMPQQSDTALHAYSGIVQRLRGLTGRKHSSKSLTEKAKNHAVGKYWATFHHECHVRKLVIIEEEA